MKQLKIHGRENSLLHYSVYDGDVQIKEARIQMDELTAEALSRSMPWMSLLAEKEGIDVYQPESPQDKGEPVRLHWHDEFQHEHDTTHEHPVPDPVLSLPEHDHPHGHELEVHEHGLIHHQHGPLEARLQYLEKALEMLGEDHSHPHEHDHSHDKDMLAQSDHLKDVMERRISQVQESHEYGVKRMLKHDHVENAAVSHDHPREYDHEHPHKHESHEHDYLKALPEHGHPHSHAERVSIKPNVPEHRHSYDVNTGDGYRCSICNKPYGDVE